MALDDFRRTDLIIDKATQRIDWQAPLRAVQGEYNGRSLRVQLTNNGVVEPQTASLLFGFHCTATHKEGVYDMTVVDAEKGLYEVFYPSEMLEKAGTVACTIKIIENTGSDGDESHISILDGISVEVAYNPVSGEAEVAENSIRVFDKALIDIAAHERRILLMEVNFTELSEMLTLNIPNMDVAVSTRAPADTALSSEVWTDERAGKLDAIDHVTKDFLWTDEMAKKIAVKQALKEELTRSVFINDDKDLPADGQYHKKLVVQGKGVLKRFTFRTPGSQRTLYFRLTVDGVVLVNAKLSRGNESATLTYGIERKVDSNYIIPFSPELQRAIDSVISTLGEVIFYEGLVLEVKRGEDVSRMYQDNIASMTLEVV